MWFLLGSVQLAGEMPGGSAAEEPVCNRLWFPPVQQMRDSFQEWVITVVLPVQTQLKWLNLFHFGNLYISIILLPVLFFPLSSLKKSLKSCGAQGRWSKSKVNLKLTHQELLTPFMYFYNFLLKSSNQDQLHPKLF